MSFTFDSLSPFDVLGIILVLGSVVVIASGLGIFQANRKKTNFWVLQGRATVIFGSLLLVFGAISLWLSQRQDLPPVSTPVDTITALPSPAVSIQTISIDKLSTSETQSPNSVNTLPAVIFPTVAPKSAGAEETSAKDGMIMMFVPDGEFIMGSNIGDADEIPVHTVKLASYWMDKTEVTNAMYKLCVTSRICKEPKSTIFFDDTRFVRYPVVYVTWVDAKTYCEWAGKRLPTEAEWEKAGRGADGRIYPWGDSINNEYANYGNFVGHITSVGEYPRGVSFYGIFDMVGNVWEWVADFYDEAYYSISPIDNPLGPSKSSSHVLRGGSWATEAYKVRLSYRSEQSSDYANEKVGFRCALSESK